MRLITNKSKNLFDYHKASKILGSATLSKQSDFILIATQTHKNSYTSVEVELDKSFVGKTVTLSALVKTSSINNPNLRIQWFKSDGLATGKMIETKNTSASSDFVQISVTGTVPENPGDGDYLCLCFYSNKDIDLSSSTESSFSATYKNIQLEIGTEVTTYQPHTWNLLNKWQYRATQTINGVTFTNNGDGTITYNGVTSVGANYTLQSGLKVVAGHKYLSYVGENTNDKISVLLYANEDPYDTFDNRFPNADGGISTALKNSNELYYQPKPLSNVSFSGFILKPQLYDLTLMYGAGNEPTTVDQFYTDHPELKVSPLGFIELKNLEISNKNIKRLRYKTADGYLDLGIIPSNSGYILNKYDNLSEELLEENIEKDTVNYHISDKTNILLNKVEGNTKKIVQLLDKTVFATSDTKVGLTFTCNRTTGAVTVNGTATASSYWNPSGSLSLVNNHKYLICGNYDGIGELGLLNQSISDKGSGAIGTAVTSEEAPRGSWGIAWDNGTTFNNVTFYPQVFDLTAMYGFGNEPTTVDQFKKDYPQFFDEKLDGIWNVRTSGVSTTGKNLFDINSVSNINNWVTSTTAAHPYGYYTFYLNPNTTYTFSRKYASNNDSVYACFSKNYGVADDFFIHPTASSLVKDKLSFTTNDTGIMYLNVYGIRSVMNSFIELIEGAQLELGSTATDYEPYQENKIDLLSTQTLNGINGVNDYIEVIDKGSGLYDLKKTQNIDSVDLGSLGFDADGNNFVTRAISPYIKPPVNNNSVGNYICQKYVNCTISKSFVDGDFGVNSSGDVYFRNSAYTTAAAFQTAMSGTILYYQLKTSLTTTIATNLTYNQVSAIRTNGGLLLVNDNNNQKYAQPNVTITENYQYKI